VIEDSACAWCPVSKSAAGHEDRMPPHGYAATREAAMAAFAKRVGGGSELSPRET